MPWKTAPEWAITYAETGHHLYGTPTGVTLAVAQLESSFNPNAINKSSGAIGIMQVLPKFTADYDRMMASVDPALKGLDLRSQKAVQGLAAVLEYYRRLAVKRGVAGPIAPWQWAVVAHRWGQNSEQIKTYQTQQRTLDVERLMRENGYWYDEEEDEMSIKTYSYEKDGATLLSPNFKVSEFRCKDGSDTILIDDALVASLQALRDHVGAAVTISSGYRTKAYNVKIGGAKDSQHLYGTAADIHIAGVDPRDIARWVEASLWGNGINGIGLYDYAPGDKPGFVHIDTRAGKPAQWVRTKSSGQKDRVVASITRDYLDEAHTDPDAPRTLRRGDKGDDVATLQDDLTLLGYAPGSIDGIFGAKTETAVKAMQRTAGLTVDGVFGPKSQAALAELLRVNAE